MANESSIVLNSTYVFDGVEVKWTGRKAKKEVPRARAENPFTFYIFEVTPVEDEAWKKWVKYEELYMIER